MKLIHLSDLHLGKRVNDFSMLEDQKYILGQILSCIDAEKPHAVLIAGDVYDRAIPSAEAVELLDDFLWKLAERKLQVFVSSGNHDSPERLAFGGRLMDDRGIHISPVYDGNVSCCTLCDEYGEVTIRMLPFVKPVHVRRFFPEETIESYTDALRVAISHMAVNPDCRNVLLTHQFVTGAEVCDSEELSVGGSDNVDASVFEAFDYVALGHIHGPQNIVPGKVRYCGTPLKYSISEARHKKSITILELGKKGDLSIRTSELIPLRDMRELRGSYAELTDRKNYLGTPVEDYLQITLTDEEDVPEAMGRLRAIYPNLMLLRYDNARSRSHNQISGAAEIQKKSPLELFDELYELQNGQSMSQIQRDYSRTLIEEIMEE